MKKASDKNSLVPKLRFLEFRGAAGWKMSRLDEVLSPVVRERPKPATAYLGLGLRSHGKGTFLKPLEDPAKNSMDQLYEVKANDLIVNITFAWEGAVAIAQECDEGALVSHRFPTYTFEKGGATPEFFKYIILDKQFVYNLGVISPGGAGRNRVLSKNDFLKLRVVLPSPAEQKKIAECLSSVDELIGAQARKVDALKTHKKGLMQNLFPREGETQPRLRFPEFRKAGEWEEKALGAMSKTTIGEFVIKTKQHHDAPYPVFNGGRSHTGFYDQFNNEGNKIVISARGANAGYVNIVKQRYWAGNSCYSVSLNDRNDCLDFVYWFMKQNEKTFTENQNAANIPAVSKGHVECFKIMLPPPVEQHRIASCLSSLDALITAETQKLEALKTHKRGLMQQLFPSMEAE